MPLLNYPFPTRPSNEAIGNTFVQMPLIHSTDALVNERQNMHTLVKSMALDDINATPKNIASKVLQIFEKKYESGMLILLTKTT
jgi:hypothetical protein